MDLAAGENCGKGDILVGKTIASWVVLQAFISDNIKEFLVRGGKLSRLLPTRAWRARKWNIMETIEGKSHTASVLELFAG